MKHFLTSLNAHVLHLAAAHDRYLSAVDPFVTLKVGRTQPIMVSITQVLYWQQLQMIQQQRRAMAVADCVSLRHLPRPTDTCLRPHGWENGCQGGTQPQKGGPTRWGWVKP